MNDNASIKLTGDLKNIESILVKSGTQSYHVSGQKYIENEIPVSSNDTIIIKQKDGHCWGGYPRTWGIVESDGEGHVSIPIGLNYSFEVPNDAKGSAIINIDEGALGCIFNLETSQGWIRGIFDD